MLTDEYCQVKNAKGVFSIGDCATIEMKKLVHDVTELFEKADENKDGSLSMDEFRGRPYLIQRLFHVYHVTNFSSCEIRIIIFVVGAHDST